MPIKAGQVRLMRGKTKAAELTLDKDDLDSFKNGGLVWVQFPASDAAKFDGSFALVVAEGAREVMRLDFQVDRAAAGAKLKAFATAAETRFLRQPMVDGKLPERLLGVKETGCRKS